jgi:anti-sigma regulatory factor (Ser/Thr protein kinase)
VVTEQSWTFTAEPDAAGGARRAVRDFAAGLGLSQDTLAEVVLCVSEAVTNAVQHAYRDAPQPGPVHLHARVDGGELSVWIRDEGAGMMPRADSPGAGLGLPTISSLAADVNIHADGRGTEVRMRFVISGGDGDA